jgi:hypothetical protein
VLNKQRVATVFGWCLLIPGLWRRKRALELDRGSENLNVSGAVGSFLDVAWFEADSMLGGVASVPAFLSGNCFTSAVSRGFSQPLENQRIHDTLRRIKQPV